METDESMQLIRTVGGFYYTNDENLDYITTRQGRLLKMPYTCSSCEKSIYFVINNCPYCESLIQ